MCHAWHSEPEEGCIMTVRQAALLLIVLVLLGPYCTGSAE